MNASSITSIVRPFMSHPPPKEAAPPLLNHELIEVPVGGASLLSERDHFCANTQQCHLSGNPIISCLKAVELPLQAVSHSKRSIVTFRQGVPRPIPEGCSCALTWSMHIIIFCQQCHEASTWFCVNNNTKHMVLYQ